MAQSTKPAGEEQREGLVSKRMVGRVAGGLFAASGLVTIMSPALPLPPQVNVLGIVLVSIIAIVSGGIVAVLPWHRWRRSASLWLVPFAFLLIALHNIFSGADHYRYGIFFVVAFAWIGMAHPQWTSLHITPLYAVAYLAPLTLTNHSAWAISSVIYTGLVCLLIAETLSWVSGRLRATQEALYKNEERFRSLIQNLSDVITVLDADGTIRYQSPSLERVLGYQPDEVVGKSIFEAIHPDDVPRMRAAFERLLQDTGANMSLELRVRRKEGSWRIMEGTGCNLLHNPAVAGIVVNSRDITERKQVEEQLLHNAFYDTLTGLPNRALFMDRLDRALDRTKRSKDYLFAILFLDLDRFKYINDSLGHIVGDQLLTSIAQRLLSCLRATDTVARFGGDEFAILLDDLADQAFATEVAERIIEKLSAPLNLDGDEVFTSASIGIILNSDGYKQAVELLRDVDTALYRAKAQGRGRYEVFDQTMHIQSVAVLQLEADLRRAIDRQEFVLHYQPIISLETGAVTGVEALLRWQHPKRGLVMPAEFIALAEETGLIVAIGEWVLHEACAQTRAWHEQGLGPLSVAVNLSAREIKQGAALNALVVRVLAQTGLEPHYLGFELIESSILEQAESVISTLEELRRLGVHLAIDDFGTGYSSLGYLKQFPITALKIDKSFVRHMTGDPSDEAIVRAIIALAQSLKLKVIGEGIELEEQRAFLQAHGCHEIQGNLLSEPAPAEVISEFLAHNIPLR